MDWFDEQGIKVEEHPPCSPDLNPIEHVWLELKRRLQKQYPDIGNTPGGPDKVRKKMSKVLPEVWQTIPPEFFEKLWMSMPDRVAAVIDAKGWYTRY
jgi:transposase